VISARVLRTSRYLLLVILAMLSVLSIATFQVSTQNSELTASSYEVFNQLAGVYKSGGVAPDLVAKLNLALTQIHQAHVKRNQGDATGAAMLEDQARSALADIQKAIPARQQEAERKSTTRALLVMASIPIVVILSTLVFYAALRTWRWYEKAKLFEMRIVEKKTTED
jgi:hypothetical protein